MECWSSHTIVGQIVDAILPECETRATFCQDVCNTGYSPWTCRTFVMQKYWNAGVFETPIIFANALVQIGQRWANIDLQKREKILITFETPEFMPWKLWAFAKLSLYVSYQFTLFVTTKYWTKLRRCDDLTRKKTSQQIFSIGFFHTCGCKYMRIIERMRAELRGFMNKSIHLFVRTFAAVLDCRSDDDISRRHGV